MASIIDISEVILELGLSASITEEERAIAYVAITRAEGAVKRFIKYDPVQRTRTEYYPQQDFGVASGVGVWEVEGDQAILRRLAEAASNELQVQHIPIRSVTTLAVDYDGRSGTRAGSFAAATEKVEGTDFWPNYDGEDADGESICRDGIIRSFGAWATTPGSIKIVYVAGYTDDELHGQGGVVDASPITDVIVSEAVRRAKKAFVMMKTSRGFMPGPLTGERLGEYSWQTDSAITSRLFGGEWDLLPENTEKLSTFINWGGSY